MSEITELQSEFFRRLRPARHRLRARQTLAVVERILPLATTACIALCVARFASGYPLGWIAATAAIAPLIVAAIWGLARPIDWSAAARAVDQRFDLADRSLTALANFQQFDRNLHLPAIAELQVRDAVDRLTPIRAGRAVDLRLSRRGRVLLVAWVLALAAVMLVSPEKLASGPAGSTRQPGFEAASRSVAVPSPFEGLPAEMLTQPARLGQPAGPLATRESDEDSYLGDNAAAGRYFELMDRKSTPLPNPR